MISSSLVRWCGALVRICGSGALNRKLAQQSAGSAGGAPGQPVGVEGCGTDGHHKVAHELDHFTAEALLEFVTAVAFLVLPGDAERSVEVVPRVALLEGVQHHAPVQRGGAVEV